MHQLLLVGLTNDDDDALIDLLNDAMKPLTMCEHCGNGEFDWWQLGARWKGLLSPGYDRETDPEHFDTCNLCSGTGVRPGGLEQFGQAWFDGCNGCNGCNGTGRMQVWPTRWAPHPDDILRVADLPGRLPNWDQITVVCGGVLFRDVEVSHAYQLLGGCDWVAVVDAHC